MEQNFYLFIPVQALVDVASSSTLLFPQLRHAVLSHVKQSVPYCDASLQAEGFKNIQDITD